MNMNMNRMKFKRFTVMVFLLVVTLTVIASGATLAATTDWSGQGVVPVVAAMVNSGNATLALSVVVPTNSATALLSISMNNMVTTATENRVLAIAATATSMNASFGIGAYVLGKETLAANTANAENRAMVNVILPIQAAVASNQS